MSGRKVYIGRLDVSTTEHTLRQFLLDFGEVENVVIITDRETGDSRGFGFATFKDQAAADLACCKSGQEIDGNQVIINYARDRGDRGGGRGGYNRDRGYNRGYDRGGYGRDYEDRGGYGGRRQY